MSTDLEKDPVLGKSSSSIVHIEKILRIRCNSWQLLAWQLLLTAGGSILSLRSQEISEYMYTYPEILWVSSFAGLLSFICLTCSSNASIVSLALLA